MADEKPDHVILNDANESKRLIQHIGRCLRKYWDDYEEYPKELRMGGRSCALLFKELGFANLSEKNPFPVGPDRELIRVFNNIPIIIVERK